MIVRNWFNPEPTANCRKYKRKKGKPMRYKLWLSDYGILKHIENLGGAYRRIDENCFEVWGVPASKIREFQGVFVLNAPRTQIEAEYLRAVTERHSA